MLTDDEIRKVREEYPPAAAEFFLARAKTDPDAERILRMTPEEKHQLYLARLEAEDEGIEVHPASDSASNPASDPAPSTDPSHPQGDPS
jgi:hypothetical protein